MTRYFKQDYPISKISLTYLNKQMREEIWKWDDFDSSKDYPLLKSEDFISNFPAIWQKLSNIENIITLINYANEWRNLKTKCMLHNYSLCSFTEPRKHLNPSSCFGGVVRKRNLAQILTSNNTDHSYANERGPDMKMRCLRFINGLPSTQQWRFHHKLPSHLAEIFK
jgi:hypothetical protein